MNIYISCKYFYTDKNSTKVFLDKLLKLNDEGADFTDEDLKDEVITMTVAVRDTIITFIPNAYKRPKRVISFNISKKEKKFNEKK